MARTEAFKTSMAEIGLLPETIVTADHTMEGGMRALVELLGARDQPTAVVCSNDMTAIGVMREAYDHGITIPTDLSVVGFDDIRLAQFMTPPLTTVQMSQKELAQIAFRALLDEVGRELQSTQKSEYELITSLVLRRSTAMARLLNDAHREQ
jgi:LacI family transcriptional regulator